MRTRQAAMTLQDLGSMGSGELLKIWLRGQGINPDGKVMRTTYTTDDGTSHAVYTEVLEE